MGANDSGESWKWKQKRSQQYTPASQHVKVNYHGGGVHRKKKKNHSIPKNRPFYRNVPNEVTMLVVCFNMVKEGKMEDEGGKL